MHIQLVLFIVTILVRFGYGDDFGCGCGYVEKTREEAEKCGLEKLKKSGRVKEGEEGRIVNGYPVGKACFKRPFLVQIRSCCMDSGIHGECMGSIINKKYVLTAAHCFCFGGKAIFDCVKNDGKKTDKKTKYGHYIYEDGTVKSSLDSKYAKNVTILIVGKAMEYSYFELSNIMNNIPSEDDSGYRTATKIIIHPEYAGYEREQNDIALIEVDRPFDFSDRTLVAPICLSNSIDEVEDAAALITGFGRTAEEWTQGQSNGARCFTGYGGPSQFEPCRSVHWTPDGIEQRPPNKCLNMAEPPWSDGDCKEYYNKRPEMKTVTTILELGGGIKKKCHPVERQDNKDLLWCATCVKGAEKGEDGYCDLSKTKDSDYTDVEYEQYYEARRQDVSFDSGWGYCQASCWEGSMKDELQEAEIYVLKQEDCVEKTKHYVESERFDWAIMPEREICAASKYVQTTLHVTKENDGYKVTGNKSEILWGDKDSCQGDSGGPLWQIMNKTAYLSGIINRGEGCSRKNVFPIYARISFHRDWILKNAESGCCTDNKGANKSSNTETNSGISTSYKSLTLTNITTKSSKSTTTTTKSSTPTTTKSTTATITKPTTTTRKPTTTTKKSTTTTTESTTTTTKSTTTTTKSTTTTTKSTTTTTKSTTTTTKSTTTTTKSTTTTTKLTTTTTKSTTTTIKSTTTTTTKSTTTTTKSTTTTIKSTTTTTMKSVTTITPSLATITNTNTSQSWKTKKSSAIKSPTNKKSTPTLTLPSATTSNATQAPAYKTYKVPQAGPGASNDYGSVTNNPNNTIYYFKYQQAADRSKGKRRKRNVPEEEIVKEREKEETLGEEEETLGEEEIGEEEIKNQKEGIIEH